MQTRYLKALAELGRLLLMEEQEDTLTKALALLSEVAQAERVSLSWQESAPDALPLLPRWEEVLRMSGVLQGPTWSFPREERSLLEARGTRALLILPLVNEGEVRGALVLESLTESRVWPEQELGYLEVAAETLSHALARRQREQTARQQALQDSLTGLANRRHLQERLEPLLQQARENRTAVAALYLDLDRFKQINDTLGHAFGDRFLQYIVRERLLPTIGPEWFLARIGGDEFVLILQAESPAALQSLATQYAQAIQAAVREPVWLEGKELLVSVSIGISCFPRDAQAADALVRHADHALYRAKEEGRGDYCFFTARMDRTSKERMEREAELRHDLLRLPPSAHFTLVFQPWVDLQQERLLGVTSQVRWHHARRGLLSAARFVPLAEDLGLGRTLGEFMLRAACAQAARWQSRGQRLRVAVPLLPTLLRQESLPDFLESLCAEYGLAAGTLELELTEATLTQESSTAAALLTSLHPRGFGLTLDDFGAGSGALALLRLYPFSRLKLSRTLTEGLEESPRDQKFLQGLISLAQGLGLEVVAGGVERAAQCSLLQSLGCQCFQGELFGSFMEAEELEQRLLRVETRRNP